jgi:hypothetical protein
MNDQPNYKDAERKILAWYAIRLAYYHRVRQLIEATEQQSMSFELFIVYLRAVQWLAEEKLALMRIVYGPTLVSKLKEFR